MSKLVFILLLASANSVFAAGGGCSWINPSRAFRVVVSPTVIFNEVAELPPEEGRPGDCPPPKHMEDVSTQRRLVQADPASDRLLSFADGGFIVSAQLTNNTETALAYVFATQQPKIASAETPAPREQTVRAADNRAMVIRARRQNGQLILGWAKSVNGVLQPVEYMVKADSANAEIHVRWAFTAANGLHIEMRDWLTGIVVSHDEASFGTTVPELDLGVTTNCLEGFCAPTTVEYSYLSTYSW
jgi:hypothetical protein